MNPPCFICESPASRVCKHPDCVQPPFFCVGPCIKRSSQKIHTHNMVVDCFPFSDFIQKVDEIVAKPSMFIKEHNEKVQKKVLRIKTSLDESLKQHQQDIKKKLQSSNTSTKNSLLSKVDLREWEAVQGKQISQFFKKNLRTSSLVTTQANQNQVQAKCLMKQFDQMLDHFEQKIKSIHSIDARQNMGPILEKQGEMYYNQEKWKEAYEALSKCSKYYSYKQTVHSQLAKCCIQLQLFDEAERTLRKCIELDSQQPNIYNNLGNLYSDHLTDTSKALQYFTKAIDLDPTQPIFYNNRGKCYAKSWNFRKAIEDFLLVHSLDPKTQQYLQNKKKACQFLELQLEAEVQLEVNGYQESDDES